MAVVIASDLGKDIAGEPLLRGISFKLERRDRMTLSGRNGAGKTTLLRMLSGEASVDFGELVFAKGAKVALHDQRPPRDRGLSPARLHPLGRAGAGGDRAGAGRARAGDGRRRPRRGDARPLRRGPGRGSSTPAATTGATARWPPCTGSASATTPTWTARWSTFSGRRADPRLARPRAGRRRPTCCCSTSPPTISTSSRSSGSSSTSSASTPPIVLVAHDRWFLEAVGTSVLELEAGRGRFFAGPWHAWRKEKAARELALGRAIERQQAEIERLERFVTRFRAGTRARQAQSRAKRLDKIERIVARPGRRRRARVRLQAARAQRPGGVRARGRRAVGRRQGAARRRRAVARARRARLAGRRQRRRQDDADRDAGRAGASCAAGQAAHRPQRQARLPLPARRGAATPGRRGPCSRPPSAPPG